MWLVCHSFERCFVNKVLLILDHVSIAQTPRCAVVVFNVVGLKATFQGNPTLHRGGWKPFAISDRKSTRLNSSHVAISYAVFCLKKKSIKTVCPNQHCFIFQSPAVWEV